MPDGSTIKTTRPDPDGPSILDSLTAEEWAAERAAREEESAWREHVMDGFGASPSRRAW